MVYALHNDLARAINHHRIVGFDAIVGATVSQPLHPRVEIGARDERVRCVAAVATTRLCWCMGVWWCACVCDGISKTRRNEQRNEKGVRGYGTQTVYNLICSRTRIKMLVNIFCEHMHVHDTANVLPSHSPPSNTFRHLNFNLIDCRLGESVRRLVDQLLAAYTPAKPFVRAALTSAATAAAAAHGRGRRRPIPRLRCVGERCEAHEVAANARGHTRGRVVVRTRAARCGRGGGGVCEQSGGTRREKRGGKR